MRKVVVEAPSKLNLAFDILGVDERGYHRVDMVMQAVSLYERVEVARSMGFALRCPGSRVPANSSNTAAKAAEAFFTETGLLAGADITVHKATPTRAGMGGGSADAAAVLVGLNLLYKARLPLGELCRIGLMVGADVPFALLGGTARAQGVGEVLTPLPPLPDCHIVAAMPPGIGVSTPLAYARYDELGSGVHPDVSAAVAALKEGDLAAMALQMQNTMQAVSGDATTEALCASLREAGALAALMTGSGAAVFGVFTDEAGAKAGREALRDKAKRSWLLRPAPHGPRVVAVLD